MSLSSKALLVTLNIHQWTARKQDKRANATVVNEHGNGHKTGNYTKKLLPGAKSLEEVTRQVGVMRTFFYEQTAPWSTDGVRILKSTNYLDFTAKFRVHRDNFEAAVDKFVAEYPDLREQAKVTLNGLFNANDYPLAGTIRNAFGVDVAYMPLPDVSDFRVAISDEERKEFVERIRSTETAAIQDAWKRLHGVVTTAVTRLQVPGAVFRDTLISNITDMCAILPQLNITDDPALEQTRRETEALLSNVNLAEVRTSSAERVDVAAKLAAIDAKMGAFMGGK